MIKYGLSWTSDHAQEHRTAILLDGGYENHAKRSHGDLIRAKTVTLKTHSDGARDAWWAKPIFEIGASGEQLFALKITFVTQILRF